ncbi:MULTISPECIES: DUF421 domain-containing protein [Brenneria]|uniref:DUF421 domain-containing protein n=1 Tax=Brenneria nigrifluens DSM 30175 = ATCC 13028 TaxID=1121120 RepID=A0A2U1UW04_9GAMM|nr:MULTISPECIES: YetF domain-containing protein [Brenneria]EHD22788.1 protein of unknown function DUF421 [Brenneria sp. EniD312]PWC25855.1 DUF421 domain-containing protein [Brenneria nigrifluens DSM 30175 = ATCC 13028]QCR05762.1 DUF421 domain-containing protein [Brenneria nigrifluens DSM 30175 = ATCC 13028]
MEYYGLVLIKFVIGFCIVIMHLNLSGKTQLSQMTPVDFIGNFVLGGIIGGVIYSDSIPLHQYVVVLFIGVVLISSLNAVSKHVHLFRAIAIGNPLPIVKKGRFLMDNILHKKNKIDILNIASQLHAQGINAFQQVTYAQIEPGGQLTVVCDNAKMPSVIVMKDGKVRPEELKQIEKERDWLEKELKRHDLEAEDIFIAEFWDGKVMFILRDGTIVK